jgi:hypothetical protein
LPVKERDLHKAEFIDEVVEKPGFRRIEITIRFFPRRSEEVEVSQEGRRRGTSSKNMFERGEEGGL